jgi:CRP/FNR family cyclic AMP-dependent transcriptional regulator
MQDILKELDPHLTHRAVKSGTTLLYQSEIPRHAIIIRKGLIRAYTITASGDERTVALYTRGDILPLSWIYGETKTTLFYYEAVSDSDVYFINKTTFLNEIHSSTDLTGRFLRYIVNEHTAQLMRITALEQANASEKVAFTLYYLLMRHGVERQPGLYTVDIKLTQTMIASLVGITRESTATTIAKLKSRGVVTYRNFIYVIDKKKLEQFLGEDSFKDVSLK